MRLFREIIQLQKMGVLTLLLLFLFSCSEEQKFKEKENYALSAIEEDRELVEISLKVSEASSLSLEGTSKSPSIVDLPVVSVGGCQSGFRSERISPSARSTMSLYERDENCVVKLEQFEMGSKTYTVVGENSESFSSWLPGDRAVFQNVDNKEDVIDVFVKSQVSQKGLSASDIVIYTISNLDEGTKSIISQAAASNAIPIALRGGKIPSFSMKQARFLLINPDGSADLSFTLECEQTLEGSSPDYTCDGASLQDDLDYIFIPDIYSPGEISLEEAEDAFASNSPLSIGSMVLSPGSSDSYGVSLSYGGFYTSESDPLKTGPSIYPDDTNYVFLMRRSNVEGSGFLYFNVSIPSISDIVGGAP